MADAYAAGLAMLARRELSTAQVRQRLARKGFGPDEAGDAVERLRRAGALDDDRTARLLARRSAHVRMHGRLRALRDLQRNGIGADLARRAVDAEYGALDEQDMLEQALSRRLDGPLDSRAAQRRMYQQLVRRGFDAAAVLAALRRHGAGGAAEGAD